MFRFVEEHEDLARIIVIGVGGAGGNAVNRMVEAGLGGVEFLAVNTDLQALRQSRANQTLQIGNQLTRGLGSGGDPRVGRKAVEEDEEAVANLLRGADMVFVTCGMGGGTGTGAAPVIARVARDLGILTVGIVTRPFIFEGSVRMRQADEGIEVLQESVDTLIVIPNQRLLEVVPPNTSFRDAFRVADNVLYEATRGIYEIIARPNHVNLDFADVRTVMKGMGVALMGTGRAEGEDRARAAARAAISSPLLQDVDIRGARGVLVNLLGSELGIAEISEAMGLIQEAVGDQANIIFGYGTDEALGPVMQVTVVATGFERVRRPERARAAAAGAAVVEDSWGAAAPGSAAMDAAPAPARGAAARVPAGPAPAAPAWDPAAELPDADDVDPYAAADPDPASAAAWEPPAAAVTEPARAAASEPEPELEFEPEAPQGEAEATGAPDPAEDEPSGRRPRHGRDLISRLVRPATVRRVPVVEEPPAPPAAPPRFRGFGPAEPGEDLSKPAYTRKYMD